MNVDGPPSATLTAALLFTSAIFFGIAGLFVLLPGAGASVYGLATDTASALFYIRAIGLRDFALAAYLVGLTAAGQRRPLSILLTCTTIIPAGDLLLIYSAGAASIIHYLLHGASLAIFAGLAFWVRRQHVSESSAGPRQ